MSQSVKRLWRCDNRLWLTYIIYRTRSFYIHCMCSSLLSLHFIRFHYHHAACCLYTYGFPLFPILSRLSSWTAGSLEGAYLTNTLIINAVINRHYLSHVLIISGHRGLGCPNLPAAFSIFACLFVVAFCPLCRCARISSLSRFAWKH